MLAPNRSAEIIARVDGASRGNPGPAAFAVMIESPDGTPVEAFSTCIGRATNNVAEYKALLAALDYALSHGCSRLRVVTDSELLARQIQGSYKVKHVALKPLHEHARRMIAQLEFFSIQHVRREQNQEADRLANQTLERAARPSASGPRPRHCLRTTATYQAGVLKPHSSLPLRDGEVVDVEIRQKS